jgi:hypothetical protein
MTPGPVPGQVVIGGAMLGAAFIAFVWAVLIVAIVAGVVRQLRERRREAAVLAQLDVHLDEALADPEVQAGLARLEAAARTEQPGGESA